MTHEPIRDPGELQLPEADEVLDSLTADGAKEFSAEMLAAIRKLKETRDFRPLQDTIDAWYKSLQFHRQMSPQDYTAMREDTAAIEERIQNDDEGQSFEELREELRLPKPSRNAR